MTLVQNISGFEHELANRLRHARDAYKASRVWARTYNRTFRELQDCSDRELRDLGFQRSDIAEVSRKAADQLH